MNGYGWGCATPAVSLPMIAVSSSMQHVIGTYTSRAAAETAIRTLESRGFSIQNVVIVDHQHRAWRKLHAGVSAEERSALPGFVVYTTDEPDLCELERAVLSWQPALPIA